MGGRLLRRNADALLIAEKIRAWGQLPHGHIAVPPGGHACGLQNLPHIALAGGQAQGRGEGRQINGPACGPKHVLRFANVGKLPRFFL